ncbi:MAG: iron-sulfur cluster insertion protein SufA [Candidatus Westeberhardia cardiocondylae]|nr:iron-sulfur cluster insertion protein SufA [Candidatus Westeberhardia cardiocondylae]
MIENNYDITFHSLNINYQSTIIVTNPALIQIKNIIKKFQIIGIRLNIKKSGCLGYIYKIEKVKSFTINDIMYTSKNTKIKLCTPNYLINSYVHGTKIDYIKNDLNYNFVFYNINISKKCGCGKSFNI